MYLHKLSATEIQSKLNRIKEDLVCSRKFEEILNAPNDVEPVIVKYGLTQHEAYMAESALINMYNYLDEKTLTNIVNGHMSNREKANRLRTTVAISLKDFKEKCAIEEIEFSKIKNNVVFIKINTLYQYCMKEKDKALPLFSYEICNKYVKK